MRGVLLAGGTGSRLGSLTTAVNKHLLPIYDKPMIHYPLSTLMLAGVSEVLVVSGPEGQDPIRRLLGDGSQWGLSISFAVQQEPKGIAHALTIAGDFIKGERCVLALGDNLFHGPHFGRALQNQASDDRAGAYAIPVNNPRDYAVVELSPDGVPLSLEEKPLIPRSSLAVPGLYFLPADAPSVAASLIPSSRGEFEITDLNLYYLREGRLEVTLVPRGTAWLDAGTYRLLNDAGNFVRTMQERSGERIACLEEVAFRMGLISWTHLATLTGATKDPDLREYLGRL